MRRAAILVHRGLIATAMLCLGTWTAVKVYAFVSFERNQSLLGRLVEQRESGRIPRGLPGGSGYVAAPPGSLLGRIDIPRIGVSAMILEGTGERWLEQGAGHVPGTALPASDGNAVIAGHRDSFFRGLSRIDLADVITVTTPAATRRYAVDSYTIVDPSDVAVMAPSTTAQLTLITCFPFNYIGPAPHRFVVRAHAIALDRGAGIDLPLAERVTPAPSLLNRPTPLSAHRPAAKRRTAARPSRHSRPAAQRDTLPRQVPVPPPPPPRKLHWWQRLFHTRSRRAFAAPRR
ncbi:MAG TPA: class D sortase [Thermoanaerobaculaceae bacterium]|nr:class D sortase [Thermoanaerobaculaceae bacterium]